MTEGFYVICYKCGTSCRLVGEIAGFWNKNQQLQCDNCGNCFPHSPAKPVNKQKEQGQLGTTIRTAQNILCMADLHYHLGIDIGKIGPNYAYIIYEKRDTPFMSLPQLLDFNVIIVYHNYPLSDRIEIDYDQSKSFDLLDDARNYVEYLKDQTALPF